MAILFTSHKKKNRILFWSMALFVVVLLSLTVLLVFFRDLWAPEKTSIDVSLPPLQVNVDILDSEELKKLESFSDIKSDSTDVGRSEPFTPY